MKCVKILFKFSTPCILSANHFFLFRLNAHNTTHTYIYYQLPPTCFGVCYTIIRGTIALFALELQCVPLATEPGISLIILTLMKILQRNLNRITFVVWEMKRNVSVVCACSVSNCCDTEQRSASQPGSLASGTHSICFL